MPRLIDIDGRTGALVDAINTILILEGPRGLTMRRIAAVSRVSTSSMLHHLGSREQMLRVAAGATAEARLQDIGSRTWVEGALALLPETSEQVLDARAWLAWEELWRSEQFLERWIAEARAQERAVLAGILDYQLTTDDLDAVVALVDGLTVSVCAPTRPMRPERARGLLTRALAQRGVAAVPVRDDE